MSPLFLALLKAAKLPLPVAEHRFCERLWRFDYAWPDHKLALEVEGGVWTGGRHTRGKGYVNDLEKYSEASIRGWILIRVTPGDLCKTNTIEMLKRAFLFRSHNPLAISPNTLG